MEIVSNMSGSEELYFCLWEDLVRRMKTITKTLFNILLQFLYFIHYKKLWSGIWTHWTHNSVDLNVTHQTTVPDIRMSEILQISETYYEYNAKQITSGRLNII